MTAAWLHARKFDSDGKPVVSASTSATLLGISPWSTRDELLSAYVGEGVSLSEKESEAMRMGNDLEAGILKGYARKTGRIVIGAVELAAYQALDGGLDESQAGDLILKGIEEHSVQHYRNGQHAMWRSREMPWLVCTPDAFAVDLATKTVWLVDAKLTGERSLPYWSDGIPANYRCQLEHSAMVLGVSDVSIGLYAGPPKVGVRVFDEFRDDALAASIQSATRAFCDEVIRAKS
jgi:predicted phage-related endonuclease